MSFLSIFLSFIFFIFFLFFFLLWCSLSLWWVIQKPCLGLNTQQSLILIILLSYGASVFKDTHCKKKLLFPRLGAALMYRNKQKGLESSLTMFPCRKIVLALPPRPVTFPGIGCDQVYHFKHDPSWSRVGFKSRLQKKERKKREADNTHNNDVIPIEPVAILPG